MINKISLTYRIKQKGPLIRPWGMPTDSVRLPKEMFESLTCVILLYEQDKNNVPEPLSTQGDKIMFRLCYVTMNQRLWRHQGRRRYFELYIKRTPLYH